MTPAAEAGRLTTVWICVVVAEGALLKHAYGKLVRRLPGDTQEWPQPMEEGQ